MAMVGAPCISFTHEAFTAGFHSLFHLINSTTAVGTLRPDARPDADPCSLPLRRVLNQLSPHPHPEQWPLSAHLRLKPFTHLKLSQWPCHGLGELDLLP